jgi:Rap1a immunity proteins
MDDVEKRGQLIRHL